MNDIQRRIAPAICLLLLSACAPSSTLDLIIGNGLVVDGSGSPAFAAGIAIREGRIVEVGDVRGLTATRTVDARGRIVAPGFIDMMGASSLPLLLDPMSAESKLRQGITTMMAGEGGSLAPQDEYTLSILEQEAELPFAWRRFSEYFAILEREGIALNVVHNVGATQIRRVVMGDEERDPTPEQLQAMRDLVAQAMADGAAGLSTALIYPPGTYAKTEEIVELARIAAKYGGVYFTHMRNESAGLLDAIDEVLRISREAAVPAHIYHLKAAGEENWPLMAKALERIASARAEGLSVTADVYPYIRNGIGLGSFIHPRHYARGAEAFLPTLTDANVRRALRTEIESTSDWENWYRHVGRDWGKVLITGAGPKVDSSWVGLSVKEVAASAGAMRGTRFSTSCTTVR
jgi:N-acyl-D-aspartate/D-glutamate deacylase